MGSEYLSSNKLFPAEHMNDVDPAFLEAIENTAGGYD